MYQGARFFFFWGQWGAPDFCCSHCVPIGFSTCSPSSQCVPNISSFVSIFFAKLSSTLDLTHISNSNEEITTYLFQEGPKFYIYLFVL